MSPSNIKPTRRELTILNILWKNGPSTVRQVHEKLIAQPGAKQIGYTTTLKFMQVMHEKGLLSREQQGVGHIYQPTISEEENVRETLDKLVKTSFKGSVSRMVMQLLGGHKTSTEELRKIRQFLDALEEDGESTPENPEP